MAAAQAVRQAGLDFLLPLKPGTVSGYVATRGELDVLLLLHALEERGVTVALPVVERGTLELTFLRHRAGETLREAGFGLLQPAPDAERLVPDILLVPMLAFDRTGARLGYGGGYYDATLSAFRARSPGRVLAIGIAYDEQEVDAIPREGHDEVLDWVLTPSRLMRCGG